MTSSSLQSVERLPSADRTIDRPAEGIPCPTRHPVYIGCAGWNVGKEVSREQTDQQPEAGLLPSYLMRYARLLSAVEINSSFYRSHRPQTYARWAATVPDDFRFAVKMPREITHFRRLADTEALLTRFQQETSALGEKRGPILIQLPPSLVFDTSVAGAFFHSVRGHFLHEIVCEPRHPTWFGSGADAVFQEFRIARVAADPAPVPAAARPGGWGGLVYYRLHGTPRIYYSAYSKQYLLSLLDEMRRAAFAAPAWCIFDNTAQGAALGNARTIQEQWNLV